MQASVNKDVIIVFCEGANSVSEGDVEALKI